MRGKEQQVRMLIHISRILLFFLALCLFFFSILSSTANRLHQLAHWHWLPPNGKAAAEAAAAAFVVSVRTNTIELMGHYVQEGAKESKW